jgi:hypothetical protein
MKWLLGALVAVSGCFNPQVPSGAFACDPPDHPQCPDGLTCVNKLCVDENAAVNLPSDGDLAMPPLITPSLPPRPAADMSTPPNPSAPPDLSQASPDLSPRPDLAHPACVATGGDCTYHNDSVCCSKYCTYSTNTCK